MDINNPELTNNIWELDRAMEEDPILDDQLPFTTILPNYPFQTYQISSSPPTQIPLSGFYVHDQVENRNHHQEEGEEEEPEEELGAMKEMMYKIAAMQPVDIDPATIHKPKRRNVRISDDPQSVAARHRRERISEKIRILQRLVPGGTKMDTASMLDEAIRYVKFLKRQIRTLEYNHHHHPPCVEVGHVPTRDWPITTTNKTLGSTAEPPPVGPQYSFGGSGAGDPICFVHEVNRK